MRISLDRPLAGLVVAAVTGRPQPGRAVAAPRYAPPTLEAAGALSFERIVDEARLIEVAGILTRALLATDVSNASLVTELDAIVTADVVAWSPTIYATSRAGLIDALLRADDTLNDVIVTISAVDVVAAKVYVEWRLSGGISDPCFVDDDLLVEPNGRRVVSGGVLVVTFRGDRVCEIRCYYDDFALLEQILTAP